METCSKRNHWAKSIVSTGVYSSHRSSISFIPAASSWPTSCHTGTPAGMILRARVAFWLSGEGGNHKLWHKSPGVHSNWDLCHKVIIVLSFYRKGQPYWMLPSSHPTPDTAPFHSNNLTLRPHSPTQLIISAHHQGCLSKWEGAGLDHMQRALLLASYSPLSRSW